MARSIDADCGSHFSRLRIDESLLRFICGLEQRGACSEHPDGGSQFQFFHIRLLFNIKL